MSLVRTFVFLTFLQGSFSFTRKEKNALEKFRPMVSNELYLPLMQSDVFLLRWIEDREYDLEAAKAKLLKAIKWRKENNIDSIQSETNPFIDKYMKYEIIAKDSLGGPVCLIEVTNWDIRRVVLAGKHEELNRYVVKLLNELFTRSLEIHTTNPAVSQWIILANYQGFTLRKQGCLGCVPFFIAFVNNYENYFTGSSRNLIAVNVPRVFDTIANLMRGAMSPGTRNGLKLYGTNPAEWEYLDKIIPKTELPLRFGGTKKA